MRYSITITFAMPLPNQLGIILIMIKDVLSPGQDRNHHQGNGIDEYIA